MVYVSLSTPYMTLFDAFLAKKHRLAVDTWGADDSSVKDVYKPLVDHISKEVHPQFQELYPYPVWKWNDRVTRIARNILVSEFLVKEWAAHFVGLDEDQLDSLAASFKFESCLKRDQLNTILRENAAIADE